MRDKSSAVTLAKKTPPFLTFENFNEIHFIPVVYFEKFSMFDIGDLIITGMGIILKLTMPTRRGLCEPLIILKIVNPCDHAVEDVKHFYNYNKIFL